MPLWDATIDISAALTTPQTRFAGQLPLRRGALLMTLYIPQIQTTYKVNVHTSGGVTSYISCVQRTYTLRFVYQHEFLYR